MIAHPIKDNVFGTLSKNIKSKRKPNNTKVVPKTDVLKIDAWVKASTRNIVAAKPNIKIRKTKIISSLLACMIRLSL